MVLPCCVSCATAAGNVVEMATGVTPTPGILISTPCGVFCAAVVVVVAVVAGTIGDAG